MRGFFSVATICFFSATAWGQSNSLAIKIGKNEGFSESTVYAILKDRKGFMWYGCSDGLWRYDGYQHIVYKHDPKNSNSLSDSFVFSLLEDSRGNIWAGTLTGGLNKLDPVTNSFTRYQKNVTDSTSLLDNHVTAIIEDKQGNIWVMAKKLSLLNQARGTFTHFDNIEINQWGATEVFVDKNGFIWLGSNADGISRFDPATKTFKNFKVAHTDPTIEFRSNVIRKIKEDHLGNLWLGTYGGLVKFEKQTEKFTHWVHDDSNPNSLIHNSIWDLEATPDGKVWIATWGGGISCFDTNTGLFDNDSFKPGGLFGVNVLEFPALYFDATGTFWFGSNAKGIYKIKPVEGLTTPSKAEGLIGKNFWQIIKGKKYTYFISVQHGLLAYNEKDGVAFTLSPWRDKKPNSLSGNRVSSISENKNGSVSIGTDFGLTIFNPFNKKTTHFVNSPSDSTSLSHNSVITTLVDSQDRLWLGTPFGLDLFLPQTNTFANWRRPLLSDNGVVSLGETREGLWVGTSTGGLNFLNTENRIAKAYLYNEKNDSSISNNYITQIFKDANENLWLGTRQGLNRYVPEKDAFERFGLEHGLHETSINGIFSRKNNHLIVRSNDVFFEYLGKEGSKIKFKQLYFPFHNSTVPKVWSDTERATYLFTENNVYRYSIDTLNLFSKPPAIAITTFKLDPNNSHPLDSTEAKLNPAYRKEITLEYDQNLFSIEFTALDFTQPSKNQYAYQLEGFDKHWTYSGTRRFVTYTNINPGTYTFRAKGSNNEGIWNEEGTSLVITILPPPWKTWWAYTLYGLTFVGLLYLGRRSVVNRERLKAQVAIEQTEKQTLRELDHLKTKFFSNITHEFRTPLTLIQGPANELYEQEKNPESKKLLNLIRNNSNRLLKLINQLLDLAKLDAREMKLNRETVSLKSLLQVVVSQFTSLAESKKIKYEYHVPDDIPQVLADAEKIETMLTNLIANAIKFTEAGGRVGVNAFWKKESLILRVSDSGRGIPPEKLEHIFERFYQVNPTDASHSEGTGIGLALVKEYTELMKGVIDVESKVGVGTVFNIKLPLEIRRQDTFKVSDALALTEAAETSEVSAASTQRRQDTFKVSDALALTEAAETSEVSAASTQRRQDTFKVSDALALLLLVEDNEDIRTFIKSCLGNEFRYSEARHGREGLELATQDIPDLIISDLMMPEMDGIEFCRRVKNDKRTDHIPFIMLTAKAAEESKLEGLQTGADDYLAKPFNKAELLYKVRNLITLRKNLQTHIKQIFLAQPSAIEAVSAEEKFILKARVYVEDHIKDETLSVETLAHEMNLSREQCYRKIIALTGMSPSLFIRKLKLNKASQLLQAKWGTVSQVAYETGFENLSYFSKAFKEEFGKLPSEY